MYIDARLDWHIEWETKNLGRTRMPSQPLDELDLASMAASIYQKSVSAFSANQESNTPHGANYQTVAMGGVQGDVSNPNMFCTIRNVHQAYEIALDQASRPRGAYGRYLPMKLGCRGVAFSILTSISISTHLPLS